VFLLQSLVIELLLLNLHVDILVDVSVSLLVVISVHIQSLDISLHIVDHINVSSIYVLHCSLLGVESDSHSLVDANDFYSVTWLHKVDQLFVGTEVDGLGGFSFRDTLWSLLKLDVLLVTEETLVVDELEALSGFAVLALVRFLDLAYDDKGSGGSLALVAHEGSLLHLGNDI
jgi:hypothetical protein